MSDLTGEMRTALEEAGGRPAESPEGCSCVWVKPPLDVVDADDIKVMARWDDSCGLHGRETPHWRAVVTKGQKLAEDLGLSGRTEPT